MAFELGQPVYNSRSLFRCPCSNLAAAKANGPKFRQLVCLSAITFNQARYCVP